MSSDYPSGPIAIRRNGVSGRAIALMVLLAFALGIGATALFIRQYRYWLPPSAQAMMFGPAAPDAPTTPGAPGGFVPPPEAGGSAGSLDTDALSARQTALAAELAALEARATMIDQDSRAAAGNAGRAEGLLIAFAARRAIDRGLSLGYIEAQLRQRFGTVQPRAVAIVIQSSHDPVTLEDLRLGLDTIAPLLTTGAATDGWWASLRREWSSLIVVRREGSPSPRPSDRLARIRRLLDAGQVESALAEVNRLPGVGGASGWITAAGRYVDTHNALDAIESAAILGQGADSAPAVRLPPPAPATTPARATGSLTTPR